MFLQAYPYRVLHLSCMCSGLTLQALTNSLTTNSSMAGSASQAGTAAPLALLQLNKASAKTGAKWNVVAYQPREEIYTYESGGAAKKNQGSTFMVTLVSTEDPSHYLHGQIRKSKKNEAVYEAVKKKMKQGARFTMSKVGFDEKQKTKFISCPLKLVVDLSSTKLDAVLNIMGNNDVQPVPTATIAGSSELGGNQYFDVTALVVEVSDIREHANNRSSFIVKIHDGTKDPATGKVKVMPLTIFFNTTEPVRNDTTSAGQPGSTMKALADEHVLNQTPISFFCISGSQDEENKFSFQSTRHTLLAPAVGTKAEELKNATALHHLQEDQIEVFELQPATASRDWSAEPAKESNCHLLSSFARTATGVPALDEGETIWQCNWVCIAEPPQDQEIRNQFNSLWLPLTCRDETGTVVLYITEKAVLSLTNVADATEFAQYHAEGRLRIPIFASIKIQRRRSKAEQNDNNFDCYIVDAAEQDMQNTPSASSIELLHMITHSEDCVLPATLAMIRRSEHYSLLVEYQAQAVPVEVFQSASRGEIGSPQKRPCTHAVVLVRSTKRSRTVQQGETGYMVETDDVSDWLQTDSKEQCYKLVSFCNLDNLMDFKLDPEKGEKCRAALVSVTTVLDDEKDSAGRSVKCFLVENVQQLTSAQADALCPQYRQMLYHAALAGQLSRKGEKRKEWSSEESPAKAKMCRQLGRSPTGPPLPKYPHPASPGASPSASLAAVGA